jgi:DNA-binding IclR family transcriptional regulator
LAHAQAVAVHDAIGERVKPYLQKLRDDLRETVILANRSGQLVQYLEVFETDRIVRYTATASTTRPIHPSASGRALLGLMAEAQRAAFVNKLPMGRFTDQTTISKKRLLAAVEQGNKRGWHATVGEFQNDTAAIASGLSLSGGHFAIVVGAPRSRAERRLATIGKTLNAVARQIQGSLAI